MNSIFKIVLSIFLLTGIGSATATDQDISDTSAKLTVEQLYQNYAWEISPEPNKNMLSLVEAQGAELSKYFTKSLVNLIRKDYACMKKTGGVCNLDFDPIYASQDPEASNIKIFDLDQRNWVKVRFRYPSTNQLVKIQYKMLRTDLGWRIDDICYSGGICLRKLLSKP